MGRQRLTLEDKKNIKKYLKDNCPLEEIAKKLGYAASTIWYEIARNGGKLNYIPAELNPAKNYRVNFRKDYNRKLTQEDYELINKYRFSGMSYHKIAWKMGISTHRVMNICKKMNVVKGKRDLSPDLFDEIKELQKPHSDGKLPVDNSVYDRIEALEQQVELLFELVKELKK